MASVELTTEALREQVMKLSVAERMLLVEDIWDSIAAERAQIPLSDAHKAELDRRLEDWHTNPDDEEVWENVKRELQG
jgi:putative addiction module component (TIGR02574 family)